MNGLLTLAKTGTMGDAAEFLTQLFGEIGRVHV